jgi:hypothetical protein
MISSEQPETDVLEQRRPAADLETPDEPERVVGVEREVDVADAVEQQQQVDGDEDDYPRQ